MDGACGELKVAMAYLKTDTGLGRARLDPASRERLGLEIGDVIEIVGRSSVAAKVFKDCPQDHGSGIVCIDGTTRANAGVSVGDTVRIIKRDTVYARTAVFAPNIPEGKTVRFDSNIQDRVREGLYSRPVMTGNDVFVPNVYLMGNLAPFTVVSTEPAGVVVIGTDTEIRVLNERPRSKKKTIDSSITYDDVGGLDEELRRIRDMIEVPLKHPELFERLGIGAPKGVLLYGPPGTGKTLIAKAVAKESGAAFYSIQGPEIVSKYYGESEGALREIFEEASKNAPSIVFIDEIDSIAPNRNQVSGEVERRIVAQLLTLMDGMSGRGDVIVIGATNREDAVDPALRRPGRFDREIEIGVPGLKGRAEILGVHLRGMPLADDVDVDAGKVSGFFAVFQADIPGNGSESMEKVDIKLNGGSYESTGTEEITTNGTTYSPSSVYGEEKKDMVVGGSYDSDVSEYAAPGFAVVPNPDGTYGPVESESSEDTVNENGQTVQASVSGKTVTIPVADGVFTDITLDLSFGSTEITIVGDVESDVTVRYYTLGSADAELAFELYIDGVVKEDMGVVVAVPVILGENESIDTDTLYAYSVTDQVQNPETVYVSEDYIVVVTDHNTPFYVNYDVVTTVPYPPIWDDDDDYVPPIVPVQPEDSGDDDTTEIVACAAAAVVAALMAAFLIIERRRN